MVVGFYFVYSVKKPIHIGRIENICLHKFTNLHTRQSDYRIESGIEFDGSTLYTAEHNNQLILYTLLY